MISPTFIVVFLFDLTVKVQAVSFRMCQHDLAMTRVEIRCASLCDLFLFSCDFLDHLFVSFAAHPPCNLTFQMGVSPTSNPTHPHQALSWSKYD